jgi:hypothetical protein
MTNRKDRSPLVGDIERPKGSTSAVPLLDDLKGILQWD